jgi:hypothetical protein
VGRILYTVPEFRSLYVIHRPGTSVTSVNFHERSNIPEFYFRLLFAVSLVRSYRKKSDRHASETDYHWNWLGLRDVFDVIFNTLSSLGIWFADVNTDFGCTPGTFHLRHKYFARHSSLFRTFRNVRFYAANNAVLQRCTSESSILPRDKA